jgi:hypothetical protein
MNHYTYYLNLNLKENFAKTVVLDNQCWLLMTYILRKKLTSYYHHSDKIYLNYSEVKRDVFPDLTTDRIYKIVKHLIAKGFLERIKNDPQQNHRINNLDNILAVRKNDE